MIPNTKPRSVFPKNRTWFALLLMRDSGHTEIYQTIFHNEQEARYVGSTMVENGTTDKFRVYPVQPQRTDDNYRPLWY